MPYFSQNMAVLKKVFPLLAEEIDKAQDEAGANSLCELKIEAASSGAPTLLAAGVYVHSKRDPEREAERLVEAGVGGTTNDESPALVLGFGLGYTATALAAKFPDRPIIVVEKRADILKKALEARDLGAFLSRRQLVFVLGGDGEGVTSALSLFKGAPGILPLVFWNRALTGLDEEWYTAVDDRIKTWFSRSSVNRATQKRFGKRWVRNLSKNLEIARDIPGISRLEGLLRENNIPVFLAAAGPGLDAASPILKEIYKRCLIVAVDTSLRFLLSRGVEPDFLVSVDPQYWNFRHLDRQAAGKTRLVAESAVYPPVLRSPFGGVFLCSSFFPLGRFIEDRLEPKGELGAGGSVATSAWDFIRFLGARTVWIAGLDLSFPELKTHFRGALFEEKSHAESGRLNPPETSNFQALRDGYPFMAKQMGGGQVLTDKRLSLYAAWFENRFSQFPEIRNLSLSGEGLAIKGLEAASKEELLALSEHRTEIEKLLSETYTAIENDFNNGKSVELRAEKYRNTLETLLQGLGQIKNLAVEAAEHAGTAAARSKLGHLEGGEREKALKKLDAANKSISESSVKEVAGFLFPETEGWEAEISAGTQDPLARHLEFLRRFHTALAEAADNNLQILSKV
jgi:hypothetical protein